MIKFRAWDKRMKVMIDVAVLHFAKDGKVNGIEYWETPYDLKAYHARNIELMQYTGLYDVNGNQYCQDDLVKWNDNIYRLIRGTYAFELYGFYRQRQDEPYDYFSEGAYLEGEIIGNIYANPELLSSGIE